MKLANKFGIVAFAFAAACGGDKGEVTLEEGKTYEPFADERFTVLGSDGEGDPLSGSAQVGAGQCLRVGDLCITPEEARAGCANGDGPVDFVLVDGQLSRTLCYGDPAAATQVVQNGSGSINVPQTNNNAILTFDPSTNGQPIQGDLSVDGNNVTIYGNGPDNTVIDGNVVITSNNTRIRGVTIRGNVRLAFNDLSIVLSRVLGNIEIVGNNATVAANTVFGNIQSATNNHVIVDNAVNGSIQTTGQNAVCEGNVRFSDDNGNSIADPEERGAALACGG